MSEAWYLFSAAIVAIDGEDGGVCYKALALLARNTDEATGMALRYAKETAYSGHRYKNHGASVFMVSEHLVLNCVQHTGEK